MAKVTVICDRCGKTIEGLHSPDTETSMGMTAGYYNTSGQPWAQFVNPGENVVCDACMWADERYIAVYGERPPSPTLSPD